MPRVILTGVAEKDGNQFTALCPELDVASCGDTVEEALDMLDDALQVYLEAVHDVGRARPGIQGNAASRFIQNTFSARGPKSMRAVSLDARDNVP